MNFSVIRQADKPWGKAFANALAANHRHLILTGSDEPALEVLVRDIVRKYPVLVHYLVTDDADTASIIAACEKINDRFEVDLLVNYAETGFPLTLENEDIRSLDRKLKTSHASHILFLHQLLPNLLLHAHARVVNLWCSPQSVSVWEQALLTYHIRFAEHLNAEMDDAGLNIASFHLPVSDGLELPAMAVTMLEEAVPGFCGSNVMAG